MYSNYSLYTQIGNIRNQLQQLENKLDGEHADGPNINLSSNELTTEQALVISGNESTNYPTGNGWFYENEELGFQLLDKTQTPKKFNFYTHSYNTNLNNLTIGQFKGVVGQFTVKDKTTNVNVPAVVIYYAVYTKPKNDGTDEASWYNSRLNLTNSVTDERVTSNIVYTLDQADYNIMTKKSSSYGDNDEILFVSIQSNSTEPVENWVFKLEYVNVITYEFTKETKLRIEGDRKQVFSVGMEYQGLLFDETYPFSYGYGSQSTSEFGYCIPFAYKLVGYSVICDSTDALPSVNLVIENNKDDNSGVDSLANVSLTETKKAMQLIENASTQPAGRLGVKVVNSSGVADEFGRYRVVLFLKSAVMF